MLTRAMNTVNPIASPSLLPTASAKSKPQAPKKMSEYAGTFEGRFGRLATRSDLYVLVEVHNERLDTPTVCLRLVPPAIATDKGLVRPEPHFGHLYLSAILLVELLAE